VDVTLDDRTKAALTRLTENEKTCLRRRLLPETAKEMAIVLGISPHAVEKRLKMARTKLGVSSSLDAARMLAASETGYQQPVPRPPDLAARPRRDDSLTHAGATRRIGTGMISGVMLMTLLIAAALALGLNQTPQTAPGAKVDGAALADATAFLAKVFESLDRDRSGFLDAREAGTLEPRGATRDHGLPPAPAPGERDPEAERKWMDKLDASRDGKVSDREYIDYMTPWILLHGVPADWKAKR
jgi:DNA-binding CsgD family transcriptional regulator